MGWMAAIHPADRELVTREWAVAVAEERDFELEYRFQRPDGQTLWLAGAATSLGDDEVPGYVGTVTNISSAVSTREALSEERRFLDAVLEIVGSLVCVFDPEGRFLRFNRACERLSGYAFCEPASRPRRTRSSFRPMRS